MDGGYKAIQKKKRQSVEHTKAFKDYKSKLVAASKDILDKYKRPDDPYKTSVLKYIDTLDVPNRIETIPSQYTTKSNPITWDYLHQNDIYKRHSNGIIAIYYDPAEIKVGVVVLWQKSPQHPCIMLLGDNVDMTIDMNEDDAMKFYCKKYDIPELDTSLYYKWTDNESNTKYIPAIEKDIEIYDLIELRLSMFVHLCLLNRFDAYDECDDYKNALLMYGVENMTNANVFGSSHIPIAVDQCIRMLLLHAIGHNPKVDDVYANKSPLKGHLYVVDDNNDIIESNDGDGNASGIPSSNQFKMSKSLKSILNAGANAKKSSKSAKLFKNLLLFNKYLFSRFGNVDIVGVELQSSIFGSQATSNETNFSNAVMSVFKNIEQPHIIDGNLKMTLFQLSDHQNDILIRSLDEDEKFRKTFHKNVVRIGPSAKLIRTIASHEYLKTAMESKGVIKPVELPVDKKFATTTTESKIDDGISAASSIKLTEMSKLSSQSFDASDSDGILDDVLSSSKKRSSAMMKPSPITSNENDIIEPVKKRKCISSPAASLPFVSSSSPKQRRSASIFSSSTPSKKQVFPAIPNHLILTDEIGRESGVLPTIPEPPSFLGSMDGFGEDVISHDDNNNNHDHFGIISSNFTCDADKVNSSPAEDKQNAAKDALKEKEDEIIVTRVVPSICGNNRSNLASKMQYPTNNADYMIKAQQLQFKFKPPTRK